MRDKDGAGGGPVKGKKKEESSKLRQMKLRRERQKRKMAGAINTDDKGIEEMIRKNSEMRDVNSLLADALPVDELDRALGGENDLAEDGKWWEVSSMDEEGNERHLASKRRTQLAWDKDRGVSDEEGNDLKAMGLDPESFRRKDGGDSMDESASEATRLQDMAVAGVKVEQFRTAPMNRCIRDESSIHLTLAAPAAA